MTGPSLGQNNLPRRAQESPRPAPGPAIDSVVQNLGQYINLIVVGLFLSVGFFSWLAKTLREQTEAKRLRDRREQAQAEQLRTGRAAVNNPAAATMGGDAPEQSAQRRLQELADRRKRQLDELRARQAAAGNPTTVQRVASVPPPVSSATRASGRDSGRDSGSAEARRLEAARRLERQRAEVAKRREAAARLAAQSQSDREETVAQARKDAQRDATRVEAARISESITAAAFAHHSVAAPVVAAGAVKAKSAPVASIFGKMSRADLRKAILLQEILSPPISARNPNAGGML